MLSSLPLIDTKYGFVSFPCCAILVLELQVLPQSVLVTYSIARGKFPGFVPSSLLKKRYNVFPIKNGCGYAPLSEKIVTSEFHVEIFSTLLDFLILNGKLPFVP